MLVVGRSTAKRSYDFRSFSRERCSTEISGVLTILITYTHRRILEQAVVELLYLLGG